jgi:hypothetical protein
MNKQKTKNSLYAVVMLDDGYSGYFEEVVKDISSKIIVDKYKRKIEAAHTRMRKQFSEHEMPGGYIITRGTDVKKVAMGSDKLRIQVESALEYGNLTKFTGDKMYMDDISNMIFFEQWRNLHGHIIDTSRKNLKRCHSIGDNQVDFFVYCGPSPIDNSPSWTYEIKLNKTCEIKKIDDFYKMFFVASKVDLEKYLNDKSHLLLRAAFASLKNYFNEDITALGRTTEKLLDKFEKNGAAGDISLRFAYIISTSKLYLNTNFDELGKSVRDIINHKELCDYFYFWNLHEVKCISCDISVCHSLKPNKGWETNIELQFQSVFEREFSVPNDVDPVKYPFMSWTINYHLKEENNNGIDMNGRSLLDCLVVDGKDQIVEDLKRRANALKNSTPVQHNP